jgi:hypothetical protein
VVVDIDVVLKTELVTSVGRAMEEVLLQDTVPVVSIEVEFKDVVAVVEFPVGVAVVETLPEGVAIVVTMIVVLTMEVPTVPDGGGPVVELLVGYGGDELGGNGGKDPVPDGRGEEVVLLA